MELPTIHEVAQSGDVATLRAVLDAGVPVDAAGFTECSDVSSALHLAAEGGHVEAVRLLLARGASAALCNFWGHTAAHLVAQEGQLEVLEVSV